MSTSTRTIVRDAIVAEFTAMKTAGQARVPEFDIRTRWLNEQETKQLSTYCIVATDETRAPQTQRHDNYDLTAVVVIYAHDAVDPRAKLDAMIEDAIGAVLQAARNLKEWVWKLVLDEITADEGTTAAGPWAQAVLRWTVSHRRTAFAV